MNIKNSNHVKIKKNKLIIQPTRGELIIVSFVLSYV